MMMTGQAVLLISGEIIGSDFPGRPEGAQVQPGDIRGKGNEGPDHDRQSRMNRIRFIDQDCGMRCP